MGANLSCKTGTCELLGWVHDWDCPRGAAAQQQMATSRPSPADRLKEAITKWEARYAHYLLHAQKMLDMEDLHGLWDAAMNASEVSNRPDQLREDLAVIEGREP